MSVRIEKAALAGAALQNTCVQLDGERSHNSSNIRDLQPRPLGLTPVSQAMGRVLHGIAIKMLRRRYGLSEAHAAAVARLLVVGGEAHG